MDLTAGSRLGPYEVGALIGAGGMGQVYRARDTRLERDVAIKVLGKSFAADEDRVRRFTIEAQATGSLNHPNILAIYDVGTHDGAPYLVTELLTGQSLREKLDEARVPVSKALDLARQIASGLAAAHAKGITHRDIKPENVFVTADGRAKILDFGLAKQRGDATPDVTRLQSATAAGVVLGTVGYMSPEQVRGEAADARSDTFSFGVVLYELLSGQRPFTGATAVQTMNAILTEDPPEITTVGRPLPPALERVVRHCLEKNPDERFQSARDLAFALDALGSSAATHTTASGAALVTPPPRPRVRVLPIVTAVLAVACIALAAVVLMRPASPGLPSYRYTPFATDAESEGNALWSPDGKLLAYVKIVDGRPQIFVRSLDSDTAEALTTGDDGGRPLFWWPDSSRIGFGRSSGLWAVSRLGGAPELVQNGSFADATLSPDGKTLAVWRTDDANNKIISTVLIASPANGALREYAPAPFKMEGAFSPVYLKFAPDGRSLLLSMFDAKANPEMWRLPMPDGSTAPARVPVDRLKLVGPPDIAWMPDSRGVVAAVGGDLWMFDVTTGAAFAASVGMTRRSEPSVSPDGSRLAFTSGASNFDLAALPLDGSAMRDVFATSAEESAGSWVAGGPRFTYVRSRGGRSEVRVHSAVEGADRLIAASPADGFIVGVVPSPDGQRVAYAQIRSDPGIWVASLAGGAPTKVTTDDKLEFAPVWSPDSRRLASFRLVDGASLLRIRTLGSSEAPKDLPLDPGAGGIPEWSPDGAQIALCGKAQILLVPPDGRPARRVTASDGCNALQWSADGRTLYTPVTVDRNDAAIRAIDVQSGVEKIVFRLPHGVDINTPYSPSLRLTLSADGKSLLTTVVHANTDIWLIENFGPSRPR